MKSFAFTLALVCCCGAVQSQSHYVALVLDSSHTNAELNVLEFQTARLISSWDAVADYSNDNYGNFSFEVHRGSQSMRHTVRSVYRAHVSGNPMVVTGPATIRCVTGFPRSSDQMAHATFEIIPESFPPDKTMIIPEGSPGATITLECSTNLVNWAAATNGFYTGTNSAKFFRIRAERAP